MAPFAALSDDSSRSFHRVSCWFGDKNADHGHHYGWTVAVYGIGSQKVIGAYARAQDGFEADLTKCPELFDCVGVAKPYMFARFERKQFRWGNAVSFLSQSPTQEETLFVPHNGHLSYEVWGVTRDQRYTVVASIGVSHRQLSGWRSEERELRTVRSLAALKKDKDYKLIEKCRPEEFEPSLKDFDRIIDALVFH